MRAVGGILWKVSIFTKGIFALVFDGASINIHQTTWILSNRMASVDESSDVLQSGAPYPRCWGGEFALPAIRIGTATRVFVRREFLGEQNAIESMIFWFGRVLSYALLLSLTAGTLPTVVVVASEAARLPSDPVSESSRESVLPLSRLDGLRVIIRSHPYEERIPFPSHRPAPLFEPLRSALAGHCLANGLSAPLLI